MDGGGMKGLATVRILKAIEKGTGKRIHELFDLICGTSTGGMLAVALGIKLMTLDQCEEIYKNLGVYTEACVFQDVLFAANFFHILFCKFASQGKLVFAEPVPKDNEAATWREKLDQLYKSSSQSFRVVVHGSKVWAILFYIFVTFALLLSWFFSFINDIKTCVTIFFYQRT
jgi:predicted acylesterase/phospholipase RssA